MTNFIEKVCDLTFNKIKNRGKDLKWKPRKWYFHRSSNSTSLFKNYDLGSYFMFKDIFMISISLFKNYDLGFNWMLKTKTRAYHK